MTDSVHRGKGILPGDFIKPDPGLTRKEAREFILAELDRWFNNTPLTEHALEISVAGLEVSREEVNGGKWPAGRLNMIVGVVYENLKNHELFGESFRYQLDSYKNAADVCLQLCVENLTMGIRGSDPISQLTFGFIETDLLPCGSTIRSFWDHTPFVPLRCAASLPTEESSEVEVSDVEVSDVEVSEVEVSEVEVSEVEEVLGSDADDEGVVPVVPVGGPIGLDERLDASLNAILMSEVVMKGPAWIFLSVLLAFVSYMWVVVYTLSAVRTPRL
jgi:hypothetical protein